MDEEKIDRRFNTGENARLSLGNIRGSVEVAPGEEGIIQITAVKHLESGDPQNTEIIMTQAEDGSVSVETRYMEAGLWFLFWRRPCRVDYKVRIPRRCALKLSGVSNSAVVEGIEGEIRIHSVSGLLTLKGLAGNLDISTVSGAASGESVSGGLRLKTVSGGVTLGVSHLARIEGSTVSGYVDIQTGLSEGPYRFHSVSGDVKLSIPAGAGCRVHTHSISGRVYSPGKSFRSLKGRQEIQVKGGGPEIFFDSVSGDFSLTATDEAQSNASPEVGMSPKSGKPGAPVNTPGMDIHQVLERIANGELSAEEGLRAIS
jgi:hypothetical protein